MGPEVSRGRLILSLGVGLVGLYFFIAVLAYFVSYAEDLPALEGAPGPVLLNNPTGWIGARIAHLLVYRGFGWAGVLFPIALLYAGLTWARGQKVRLRYIGWGLVVLYLASTFGGWLVQMGWVEDLLWCGSVGAGITAWLSLYLGSVGLGLVWMSLAALAVFRAMGALRSLWEAAPSTHTPESEPALTLEPEAISPSESSERPPENFWYQIISVPPSSAALSAEAEASSAEFPSEAHVTSLPAERSLSEGSHPAAPPKPEGLPQSEVERTPEPSPMEVFLPSDSFLNEKTASSTELAEAEGTFSVVSAESPMPPTPITPSGSPRTSTAPLLSVELLEESPHAATSVLSTSELEAHKDQIVRTLQQYGIQVSRITATVGPTVTLFELVPAPGVRISKIKSLEDDIALSLAALGIRIIAPIPGKGTIGIEVPHASPRIVPLRELLSAPAYRDERYILPLALGKTITNEAFVRDLAQMPHLLIAGATGQGKSVALNCMLLSLLYRLSPQEVRFVLIDPKKVEMSLYQGLESQYLAEIPGVPERIITDVRHALPALQSLVLEMELRYELLKELQVRSLAEYNARCAAGKAPEGHKPLPYLVLIIDELADLMMTAGKEVETPICRLAQLARAVGIHLIVATQRPSVNVITGLIKANFPVRLSFRVVSRVDSRVILDMDGAERLIGRGDMLFVMGTEVHRLQSGYVSTAEIARVVGHIAVQPPAVPYVLPEPPASESEDSDSEGTPLERDPLFYEAALLVIRSQQGSTSLLQRKLGIGFNRAGRLMDQLERAGVVGPARGSKPREVLLQDESALQALL